jgi:hypothetical protein
VHAVRIKPSDITMGITHCEKFFTWPLYCKGESAAKWTGSEAHITCLECIVQCP